jgi:pimeloyl-ACP methyl ester carboxylesterase
VERASFVSAAERELSTIPDLPGRMRRLAAEMRPPPDLATSLGAATHVHLVWGRRDRAYPPLVARRLAATVGAQPAWIDAGHYAMWEAPDAFARAVLHAVG